MLHSVYQNQIILSLLNSFLQKHDVHVFIIIRYNHINNQDKHSLTRNHLFVEIPHLIKSETYHDHLIIS